MGANRKVDAEYRITPLREMRRRGGTIVLGVVEFDGCEDYELHDGEVQDTPTGQEFIVLRKKRRKR